MKHAVVEMGGKNAIIVDAAHAAEVGEVLYQYPASRVPREGYFVGPVIASGVPPEDRLAREELLGPLVCAFRV